MFERVVLTAEEHRRVEDAYVDTACAFAAASGLFVESFVSPHHPAAAP